jgi:AraC family ethanolamine operon transcriptional activator
LLDEVADTCELWDTHSTLGSNQIVRCQQRADLDKIRHHLVIISRSIRNSSNDHLTMLAHKHDLVRELLETLAAPQEIISLKMTKRKQLVLRRTLDYLEANPSSPITVHQLAKETGAGVRTLEYMFRDYFGVTPKAYLSARRLAGARRELQLSEMKPTFVRDIAHRWGFWHLGRFSADYKRFFGELPSETLEKNRYA